MNIFKKLYMRIFRKKYAKAAIVEKPICDTYIGYEDIEYLPVGDNLSLIEMLNEIDEFESYSDIDK